jgi:hypothetical protein
MLWYVFYLLNPLFSHYNSLLLTPMMYDVDFDKDFQIPSDFTPIYDSEKYYIEG